MSTGMSTLHGKTTPHYLFLLGPLGALTMDSLLHHHSLSLQTDYIWPPSRKSAPLLGSLTLALAVIVVLVFRQSATTELIMAHRDKKRRLIMAQLAAACAWDQELPEEEDCNDKDGEKEKKVCVEKKA